MSVDLHWPNSLVVYDDKLYIGDGRGKIIVSNIEGTVKFLKFGTCFFLRLQIKCRLSELPKMLV